VRDHRKQKPVVVFVGSQLWRKKENYDNDDIYSNCPCDYDRVRIKIRDPLERVNVGSGECVAVAESVNKMKVENPTQADNNTVVNHR
jgi:hypothetical protein